MLTSFYSLSKKSLFFIFTSVQNGESLGLTSGSTYVWKMASDSRVVVFILMTGNSMISYKNNSGKTFTLRRAWLNRASPFNGLLSHIYDVISLPKLNCLARGGITLPLLIYSPIFILHSRELGIDMKFSTP